MLARQNDGIMNVKNILKSLNVNKVTNVALALSKAVKPEIRVREFVFHYAIYSCAHLTRELTQTQQCYYQIFFRYCT